MASPDPGARHTLAFLRAWLPAPPATVVEVGCGVGLVAAELKKRGYRVVGFDADPAAVERARARGVDAWQGAWPDVEVPRCQAVLFTRSLHHIRGTRAALERAHGALRRAGTLLIEDFAVEAPGPADLRAFAELAGTALHGPGSAPGDGWPFRLAPSADPVALWRAEHADHARQWSGLARAVGRNFQVIHRESTAYFFRYLEELVPTRAAWWRAGAAALKCERQAAAAGLLRPPGRRLAARRLETF